MLFPSYLFLFAFLPIVFVGFLFTSRPDRSLATARWLVFGSLCFYAWWRPAYLPLLLGSIAFNFSWALFLARGNPRSRWLLGLGVATNLGLLGWFKYAGFGARTLEQLMGLQLPLDSIVLPLAISFFTFQQVSYLVEVWRGDTPEPSLLRYALYVSFFPQLIAGPIVHYHEVKDQITEGGTLRIRWRGVEVGLAYLVIGLFKKTVLADGVAPIASAMFDGATGGTAPAVLDAWLGTLAYSLQIYFDFSGYSDMAIGLGLLFGVRLPFNFASPYQSANIIDFWRRWHITLSRFLRDYLYISLGGNRRGAARRYANLVITMLLGGLWHGAAWNFVFWGGLHGVYLLINHAWRAALPDWTGLGSPRARRAFSRGLTFAAVSLAWVFFRAADFESAWTILGAMAGATETAIPDLGDSRDAAIALTVPLLLAWFAPNSQQILAEQTPALDSDLPLAAAPPWLRWQPSARWALLLASAAIWATLEIGGVTEFLYFNF